MSLPFCTQSPGEARNPQRPLQKDSLGEGMKSNKSRSSQSNRGIMMVDQNWGNPDYTKRIKLFTSAM